ncbi:MAG: DNA alkylation repair protein [Bdellovibrionales bacterium]|nr:DNA alkylation repair protein [Bdellovibrionales bacterium]
MTLEQARVDLKRRRNATKAKTLQRFFKTGPGEYAEGDKFLGVVVPQTRAVAKKFQTLSLRDALILLKSPWHEERLLALFLMVGRYRREPGDRGAVYKAYLGHTGYINNWDLVDSSAEHIVGPYLADRSKAPLKRLARSKSLWERRIAVLATFHYIKQGDFKDALALAAQLLRDEEDLIHKAVGWMLREIGKRDLPVLDAFLRKHCQQMPRTMLRYAIEKHPPARRRAYLSGQIH